MSPRGSSSLTSPSPRFARLIASLCIVLLACVDIIAGPNLSFVLFAMIPIAYAGWFDKSAYPLFLACSAAGLFSLEAMFAPTSGLHIWNGVVAAVVLSAVAVASSRVRRWHTLLIDEVESRYTRVVEAAIEGILATDNQWVITFASKRTVSLFGSTSEDLLGKNLLELVHDADAAALLTTRALETSEHSRPLELEFTKKGGEAFWALVTFTPTRSFSGTQDGTILLLTDISELKKSERELTRRYQEISAMQRLSSGLSQSLDVASRLENAVETVLEVTGFEAGLIYLIDEPHSDLVLQFHRGVLSSEFLERAKRWRIGRGVTGQSAQTGVPYFVEDALTNPVIDQHMCGLEGIRGFVSIPLVSKERVQGVLNIISRNVVAFNPGDQLMLQTLGKQIGISLENARLYEMARQREQQIRRLSIDLVQVQEEERRRFAREIHDGLSQLLTTLKINAELAMKNSETDPMATQKRLREVIALANEAQVEAKQIAYDLRPAVLDDFGLNAAISLHGTNFERRTGIVVDIHLPPTDSRFGSLIETTLYRIVQELLANVAKHSKATRVIIQMLVRNHVLALVVADNGKGFEPARLLSSYSEQPHYGLRNVRERVEFFGGTFRTESSPGNGSEFMIELPVPEEAVRIQLKEKVG